MSSKSHRPQAERRLVSERYQVASGDVDHLARRLEAKLANKPRSERDHNGLPVNQGTHRQKWSA